jgi:hypothetical protein
MGPYGVSVRGFLCFVLWCTSTPFHVNLYRTVCLACKLPSCYFAPFVRFMLPLGRPPFLPQADNSSFVCFAARALPPSDPVCWKYFSTDSGIFVVWYYAAVRLLHCVHVHIKARRLRGPVYQLVDALESLGSRACCFSTCQGLRPRRVSSETRDNIASDRYCLPTMQTVSARGSSVIGAQSPGPPMPLSTLRRTPHDVLRKT